MPIQTAETRAGYNLRSHKIHTTIPPQDSIATVSAAALSLKTATGMSPGVALRPSHAERLRKLSSCGLVQANSGRYIR
jgi:hypothetical protein